MSDRVSKIILAFLSCTETQNVLFRDYGTPRNITSTKIWTTQVLRQSWKGALSGKKNFKEFRKPQQPLDYRGERTQISS